MLSALLPVWSVPTASSQTLDLAQLFDERNLEPVRELLGHGEYELVARIGETAVQRGQPSPEWRLLRLEALRRLGQLEVAFKESGEATAKLPENLELLMMRHDLAVALGRRETAQEALQAINRAARAKPLKDRTAREITVLGRAALAAGADAQKVIEQFFKAARKADAKAAEPCLAAGWLAIEKNDFARAAEEFRTGLKEHGETADLRYGLAKAYDPSDREKSEENIKRALEVNPHHEGALLLRAEHAIGAERFVEAEALIQQVLDVDAASPQAWAYRAAVAYVTTSDEGAMKRHRDEGLKQWAANPEVDHIIGRCVSRAYRFAEGAAHQRQALAFDPGHLRAKVQLSHDLLRLGQEEEAWKLAAEVRAADGYQVQAHNIGLLEKEMERFVTKTFPDFVIRMPEREWPVYGERALALLREARAVLSKKYGLDMNRAVLVEFFPSQQDFAIRTFGNLGGQGILGACFGTVVTMNSPGSLAHGRNNWESTLWHEFCHVVTLSVTKNRMPRWLSEGISVYEEAQRDPAWGMRMTRKFRGMILDDGALTPVSELSSAFLHPESDDELMFAYYESSQVVQFLIDSYGEAKFRAILTDLAAGKRINEAIAAQTASLDKIEKAFAAKMQMIAGAYGSSVDWKKPTPEEVNPLDPESFASYLKAHPKNFWAARKHVSELMDAEQWEAAVAAAQRLIELVPDDTSDEGGYLAKAEALRHLGKVDEEAAVLRDLCTRSSDVLPALLRLVEIESTAQRWDEVRLHAMRATALNPFLAGPQTALARAADALGDVPGAISGYERMLSLETDNRADVLFRLARLHRSTDLEKSRRYVLDSLALAPRFREAHRLLLDLKSSAVAPSTETSPQ